MSPVLKTTTVTVNVDKNSGTMNVVQSPKPGENGEFLFELDVTGTSAATVKAYMSFLDQSGLKPDAGTLDDSFQGIIFPFQDANGNALTPTFNTQTTQGSVSIVFSVFVSGSLANQPSEAVVIVDW